MNDHSLPDISTLPALLKTAAKSDSGVAFYSPGQTDAPSRLTYKSLVLQATSDAALLATHHGCSHDGRRVVLIHMDTQFDNIRWFWAAAFAGMIPTISTPFSHNADQRMQHLLHLEWLLQDPLVLSSKKSVARYPELRKLQLLITEDLERRKIQNGTLCKTVQHAPCQGEEPAVLMLTSGSTGHAKAVSLTVPQILASVCSKSRACATNANSVLLNWIGLDHVANMLEIHLHAISCAAEQIQIQAGDVIADPLLFLKLVDRHRVTMTFAPNFFLSLLNERLSLQGYESPKTIDLSSLRRIVSGGEANVVDLARVVSVHFRRLGALGVPLTIAYGLTETCAAISYGLFDAEREEHEQHGFASVGAAIDMALIRVQSTAQVAAQFGEIGEVQVSGPAVFKSYYRNPDATTSSFTQDGWFRTGDRGYLDTAGRLNLVGRDKEILIINGRNCSPQDIETALDKAGVSGTMSTFFAAFAHRPIGGETEGYCVVYGTQTSLEDPALRDQAAELVASIASTAAGARPDWVVPVPTHRLQKSSLGKLSRTKLKTEFLTGALTSLAIRSRFPIQATGGTSRVSPKSPTEHCIVKVLHDMVEIPIESISIDQTIFALGLTSISLFRFEHLLRQKMKISGNISLVTFLNSPVIQHIAKAIDKANATEQNPVFLLQPRGNKHPLWLFHPASGNMLSFLPLARAMTDRPLYALTMRGNPDEDRPFSSLAEIAATYYQHIKRTQPDGPYALAGYSLGTTVSFEVAKKLEQSGSRVAFLGAIDSPPHIKPLMQQIDWPATAIRIAYFLRLISQDDIPLCEQDFKTKALSRTQIVDKLLEVARPEERNRLDLTPEQLMDIADYAENFAKMARVYEPEGSVEKIDVMYCVPLKSICADQDHWLEDYLGKWQNFSRSPVEYTHCEGVHADMLNPEYVEGFQERLSRVLAARGL
ncbi:unnamed protein product [Penicillium olsonii]|nr:unnamed protein product [Penicillium olsonii]